tara:strand:- start:154 stop:795 length:642 start_codon:yes stop_codon:yes gene_type:complete
MEKSINSVNVLAIDEEKLKFRITCSVSAPNTDIKEGVYQFELPIPTALANDEEYNSCVIDCNGFQAYALGNVADPSWNVDIPGAPQRIKQGCIELQIDIPSSQTITSTQSRPITSGVGDNRIGGYREVLFMKVDSVGDGNGNVALGGRTAVWNGSSPARPILCGNPFGKRITIRNHDVINDAKCYLVSFAAGVNSADVGHYVYSFDITMVPNK